MSRRNELSGIAIVFLSAFFILSLLSYHPADGGFGIGLVAGSLDVHNWFGRLGAFLAGPLFFFTFGYPVMSYFGLTGWMGIQRFRQRESGDLAHLFAYVTIWNFWLSVLLVLLFSGKGDGYYPGGMISGLFVSSAQELLGITGTWFVVFTMILVTILVTTKYALFKPVRNNKRQPQDPMHQAPGFGREPGDSSVQDDPTIMINLDNWHKTDSPGTDNPVTKPSVTVQETPAEDAIAEATDSDDLEILAGESLNPNAYETLSEEPPEDTTEAAGRDALTTAERQLEIEEAVHVKEVNYDRSVKKKTSNGYKMPTIKLLVKQEHFDDVTEEELRVNAQLLEDKLGDFSVSAKVVKAYAGPVVTMFELLPAPGVKISRITNLSQDLALAMQAKGIRIIAPIPGKSAVGIEIPNRVPQMVRLQSLINSKAFSTSKNKLTIALGKTINGDVYVSDLAKMPHLLMAGTTGSGKSVGINTIIASILYRARPNEVKFVMIDPKMLELSIYQKLERHHLAYSPELDEKVITKPENAVLILNAVVQEMENRYRLLSKSNVRKLDDYNAKLAELGAENMPEPELKHKHLPYIVVVIDELADLMITASKEVEAPIARLAQMARAVGIHLVVATQRPSVDVLTGVIKANFPTRLAFQVAQKNDSRTILDMGGADQLLGNGDMLFLPPGLPKPIRLQSGFISTEEVEALVSYISIQEPAEPMWLHVDTAGPEQKGGFSGSADERDKLFEEAKRIVVLHQQGSVSLIQRRLKVGYARAARIMDQLEAAGVVGPFEGSKAREVLLAEEDL
jgi:S-DNA-T family DNA segregation ATPase FtsK/SpoIIIE